MMKKVLLALVATIVCATTSAEPISRQQAQLKAAAFLKQQNPKAILTTTAIAKAPRKVNGQAVGDQAYYYVFNTEGNHGFVIASGDDVAIPILAYSDEGSFDEENIPDNMRAFLQGYEREIAWAIENGYKSNPLETGLSKSSLPLKAPKSDIPYMVTAKWDQVSPYNTGIKYGTSSTQTTTTSAKYTGCVATAMAQVMYYWAKVKNFTHGSTAIPAYSFDVTSGSRTTTYYVGAKSAISAFSWSYMSDAITTSSSTNAKNAVGKLMEYCGASVKMEYTASGSGAASEDIPSALINYFGYDKGAKHVMRSEYTSGDWEELIYQELANGRPVLMDGVDFTEFSGHEFVCDGYQASTNKFHINWGWGSTSPNSNGYFALSALAPGGTGSGGTSTSEGNYTPMSGAVIGIQPPIDDSERETSSLDQMTLECLYVISPRTVSRDARSQGADVRLRGVVFNTQSETVTYQYALGIYNEAGELVTYTGYRETEVTSGGGFYYNQDFSFAAEYPYGTYKMIPICRVKDTEEWYPMQGASAHYVQAVVDKETVVFTPSMSLKINSVSSEFYTTYQGTNYYINTFNVTNDGLETFTGTGYLIADDQLIGYFDSKDLAPGETADIQPAPDYSTVNIQETTSAVYLLGDGYGVGTYFAKNYEDVEWDINFEGDIDNNLNYYHDTYKALFTLNNKSDEIYSHDVTLTLFESGKDVSTGTTVKKAFTVPAKGSVEIPFEFNAETGKTYDLQFKFYEGNAEATYKLSEVYGNSEVSFLMTMAKGISVLSEDGYAIYNDNNISGTLAVPDSTYYVDARYSDKAANLSGGRTNTIFLLKEGTTPPEALAGRNVVIGSAAETITISDDEELYTPADFTAQNVTYKRTFDAGFNGDEAAMNWNTIMLPFDVQNVTCDGNEVDWYRSAEDVDKDFWLMDFTGETADGKAEFSYAQSIEANHPYLITVPDNAWGAKWNLVGKEITFTGQNAEFKADMPKGVVDRGGKYDFIGRTWETAHQDKYCINDAGTEFEYVTGEWMFYAFPFRGYFVAYYDLGEESNVVLSVPAPTPTPATTLLGDVNKDGSVTIADVTALVNIILGKATDDDNYDLAAANVNEDETVSVADVTALVNIILGKTEQAAGAKSVKAVDQKKQTSASGKVLHQAVEHSKGVKALLKGERRTNVNSIKNLRFPPKKCAEKTLR